MNKTQKCLVCLKKAEYFTGHLLTETNEMIIGGFCKKHLNVININFLNRQGCLGAYHSKYGIQSFKYEDKLKEKCK